MVIATMFKQAIRLGMVFLYGSTGETIIEKSGHLNLGIPGIMCVGAVGGCVLANSVLDTKSQFLIILMAIIGSMLFAGIVGALYGFFTITLRCNQNVTGLTITTLGTGILGFWGSMMGNKGTTFVAVSQYFTKSMFGVNIVGNPAATVFLSHGTLVYVAIIIAVIAAIVLKKTKTGLSLNAIGENPAAADAVGINVTKYKYISCILGAAIAGIGGAFYVLDCSRGSLEYVIDAMGWLAVALVIFSLWRPGIGIIGSIVFGLLYVLPNFLPSFATITLAQNEIIKIIPYGVTALVLIIISFFNKRETQPPTSLGISYFREER